MQANSRNVRPWQVCYHQCEAAISVLSWLSWLSSKRAFMIIINVRLQAVWYHDQCETAQACYHESRLSSMWGCNKFFQILVNFELNAGQANHCQEQKKGTCLSASLCIRSRTNSRFEKWLVIFFLEPCLVDVNGNTYINFFNLCIRVRTNSDIEKWLVIFSSKIFLEEVNGNNYFSLCIRLRTNSDIGGHCKMTGDVFL